MNKKVYSTPTTAGFSFEPEGFVATSFGINAVSEEQDDFDGNKRSQKKDMWGKDGKIWD